VLNFVLIVFCLLLGCVFRCCSWLPSIHAVVAVHMKREDRRHREIVDGDRAARSAARLPQVALCFPLVAAKAGT
jgi:hypothetical protein